MSCILPDNELYLKKALTEEDEKVPCPRFSTEVNSQQASHSIGKVKLVDSMGPKLLSY